MINLNELMMSACKFKKIWESACKNHRVLYFQIDKEDKGIPAHFHPFGEDHAFILDGKLTYDLSFEEQLVAEKESLVFGWTNAVHGYHNSDDTPVHILVFATPEHNESVYDKNALPVHDDSKVRYIKATTIEETLYSNRMVFSSIPPNDWTNTLTFDYKRQRLHSTPCDEPCADHLFITFKSPRL